MTTLDTVPETDRRAPSLSAGSGSDTDTDRGRTTVEERAVERIVAHAVSEVDGIAGSARASARLDGETTTLEVRLSVTYPASVTATTERAREHVVRRATELTGLRVSRVDIVVAGLRGPVVDNRRVR
ncbi:Uncharacterized conserved protein YloU, alkaline shock protein (Asp23) family [Amycolatopsis marina]|uniref:Uncharacterized conserved protein YloU, alkaline shock protein (Asp23) family n=1 Tax=Amycolatopsis marina TaxID=490629 RepID=A0A1I0VLI8_9PSEU|nr:alkaline shock response membrane anchor protein AmaP [Amycolatopsis marina]SFA77078.1 Uncharacterized conserved protein YloU, alkaline shock protein (Asp23) family [Amycolatopsis marina]